MDKIDEIYHFWFQGMTDQTTLNAGQMPAKMWFMKSDDLDRRIKDSFETDLIDAGDHKLSQWEETTRGRLAVILLCDQFSRNIYRNSPRMFAFDGKALELSLRTIEEGADKELMLFERVFLYLPLEHSESPDLQELSLKKFQSLVEGSKQVNPANIPYFKGSLGWAQKHYDIIKQFGRFPHRNGILGRTSTAEESEFLKTPGSGF